VEDPATLQAAMESEIHATMNAPGVARSSIMRGRASVRTFLAATLPVIAREPTCFLAALEKCTAMEDVGGRHIITLRSNHSGAAGAGAGTPGAAAGAASAVTPGSAAAPPPGGAGPSAAGTAGVGAAAAAAAAAGASTAGTPGKPPRQSPGAGQDPTTPKSHGKGSNHKKPQVGRCRWTVSTSVLKAPLVSALEARIPYTAFNVRFQFQLALLHPGDIHRGDRHARGGGAGLPAPGPGPGPGPGQDLRSARRRLRHVRRRRQRCYGRHRDRARGKTVQAHPIKPTLKAPGTKHLTLEYNELLSNSGFKFNLRRYTEGTEGAKAATAAATAAAGTATAAAGGGKVPVAAPSLAAVRASLALRLLTDFTLVYSLAAGQILRRDTEGGLLRHVLYVQLPAAGAAVGGAGAVAADPGWVGRSSRRHPLSMLSSSISILSSSVSILSS